MLSKSTTHNPNYLCKIVKVEHLRKHPNADRLLVFTVDGNNIITSNTTQPGTIGIYFPLECQIDSKYLKMNNEYQVKELNSDTEKGGFFQEKGRVKALKLRGEKSEGYVAPISTLEYLLGSNYSELEKYIGTEFDTVNGELLVKKYTIGKKTASLVKDRNAKIKKSKIVQDQFRFHYDTEQIKKNVYKIKPSDYITISWKMHGTSFVSGRVLCTRPLKWYERLAKALGIRVSATEYDNIFSSRKVIKNDGNSAGQYYSSNIHADANDFIKHALIDGETVYGEVVGYEKTGGYIQKGYDYGCKPGAFKIYIYRVTHTNHRGQVTELSYDQVVERAEQLGVEACPLIYHGEAAAFLDNKDSDGVVCMQDRDWQEAFIKELERSYVYDQDCQFCSNKVPAEGVVVRKEGLKPSAYKLKAFRFLEHETKELDKGEVNIEDEVEASETA